MSSRREFFGNRRRCFVFADSATGGRITDARPSVHAAVHATFAVLMLFAASPSAAENSLLQEGGSRLVDERDDFTDERFIYVLVGADERLPGVPEAGGVPTLAFYCEGAGELESSLMFLTVRGIGASVTVEYRFDRKKTREANATVFRHTEAYGAIEREVKSVEFADATKLFESASTSSSLIVRISDSNRRTPTIRFDLESARPDLNEFERRCARLPGSDDEAS